MNIKSPFIILSSMISLWFLLDIFNEYLVPQNSIRGWIVVIFHMIFIVTALIDIMERMAHVQKKVKK